MSTLQALALLEHVQDCDASMLLCPPEARSETQTPLSLTALASLSGALDDAADWAGLSEAINHGFALVSAEIVSYGQWGDEVRAIARQAFQVMEGGTNAT